MVQVIHQTIAQSPDRAAAMSPCLDAKAFKRQALGALGKLPPFSPIFSKLITSLGAEDVSFATLGDLIEKDAVLAGRLMGIVNSAMYARRSTINSVRHALSVLGIDKVRNTVLGMSVSCMLNQAHMPPGWSMERFNKHSVAVATLSDLIAQRTPGVEYPEGAFMAGLLHDMGRLLIAIGLPQEFQSMLREYQTSDLTWIECEQKTLGFTHPELSAAVMVAWRVPEPTLRAAAQHHDPEPPKAGVMGLGWVLHAANQYINSLGESILPVRKGDAAGSVWIESLGLDRAAVALLLADFEKEHSAIAPYFR